MSSVVYLMLLSTISAYNLTCPHVGHWTARAKARCNNVESYVCLWDEVDEIYAEKCTGPKRAREGFQSLLNLGNFNKQFCYASNYQPFQFTTIGSKECIYQKSACNEEGQVYGDIGSPTQDTSCRCDYTNGYAFVSNKNRCNCNPSAEDCSCYLKLCGIGELLSPDYICTKDINPKQNYTCPVLSTKFDNIFKEPIALKYEEEYKAFMDLAARVVLVVVIMTTALIVVLIFYWRNLDELFDKCQKGYVITDKPKTIIKNEGERVTITYELSKNGLPVKWYNQNRRITDMKDNYLKENTGNFYCLTVLYVSKEVAGRYYLTFDEVSAPITELQVREITTEIIKEEGQSVIISYELPKSGLPIYWLKDGGLLVTADDTNIHVENIDCSYKIMIKYLSSKNAGRYRLKAGDMYSSISVIKVKPIFESDIESVTCIEGKDAVLQCEVMDDIMKATWFKDGKEITNKLMIEDIGKIKKLKLTSTKSTDSGTYQIKVQKARREAVISVKRGSEENCTGTYLHRTSQSDSYTNKA